MVWPVRAAIKILRVVAALLFQKLLHASNKIPVPLGGRPPYMGSMKKTVLASEGEIELLLLGSAVDILELNGMWKVLKFTLLIRIAL
ncbi:hypothetical protein TNCV_4079671 [Trichonephila clavipes]|nr:hypothetical protein TNCV_4079671 [Trichonephila clavipes]